MLSRFERMNTYEVAFHLIYRHWYNALFFTENEPTHVYIPNLRPVDFPVTLGARGPIQYRLRRHIVRYRKVSNSRDLVLKCSYRDAAKAPVKFQSNNFNHRSRLI